MKNRKTMGYSIVFHKVFIEQPECAMGSSSHFGVWRILSVNYSTGDKAAYK